MDKTPEQLEQETKDQSIELDIASMERSKEGHAAMQAESAKAEADPERAAEIAKIQEANEKAGLIFPPEPAPEIEPSHEEKASQRIDQIQEAVLSGKASEKDYQDLDALWKIKQLTQ